VKLRRNPDIEAAFVRNLRLNAFVLAQRKVIVYCGMKIFNKLFCGCSLIRNKRTNSHDLAVKNPVFLGKLNASDIASIFDFTFDEAETLLGYLDYKRSDKGRTSGSRVMFTSSDHVPIFLHKPLDVIFHKRGNRRFFDGFPTFRIYGTGSFRVL